MRINIYQQKNISFQQIRCLNDEFINTDSFKLYVVGDSFSSDVVNMVKKNSINKNIEIIKEAITVLTLSRLIEHS